MQAQNMLNGDGLPLGLDSLHQLIPDNSELMLLIDLLRGLLLLDPYVRPTVQQALSHPYFTTA